MYFDTHAHYDDPKFDEDRTEVLNRLRSAGVDRVLDPGCDLPSSRTAQNLAETYDFVYFAAGIHPEELKNIPEDYLQQLAGMAENKKCLAIGEIGLDYYWDDSQKELQKDLFVAQLKLASDLRLPVIIHDRDAHGDCLEIIRKYTPDNSRTNMNNSSGSTFRSGDCSSAPGVFHCYSGSAEMAEELLRRGWYLGFDGPVTYKNARKALEVLQITPLDRILIETDSPYLSPVPKRGERNDSGNLVYIVEKIAAVKGETTEKIAEITTENACRLFQI